MFIKGIGVGILIGAFLATFAIMVIMGGSDRNDK